MESLFLNYKIPEDKIFRHEGQTKYINRSNLPHLNKLINSELLDQRNHHLPFVTFHLASEVLPSVFNEHVESMLEKFEIPKTDESVFYPTLHEVENLFDEGNKSIGIQCGINSSRPIGFSESFYKSEREELIREVTQFSKELMPDSSLQLNTDEVKVFTNTVLQKKSDQVECVRPRSKKAKLTSSSSSVVNGSSSTLPKTRKQTNHSTPEIGFTIPIKSSNHARLQTNKIDGGIIGGGHEIDGNCKCGVKKCNAQSKNLFLSLVNKKIYHAAYLQQFYMQEYNRSNNEDLYPDPLRQFEITLNRLALLNRKESFQCIYPIVKTFLRFEKVYKGHGFKDDLEYDMSQWTNMIRDCFTVSFESGITYPWTYIGLANTIFLVHLEDFKAINSVNILVYGKPKVWIFIHEDDKAEFERVVLEELRSRAKFTSTGRKLSSVTTFPDCFLGHKSCFIHPYFLDQHGINYTVFIQEVGDMVVTKRNSYHWGINVGINVAYAQNAIFEDYVLDVLQNLPDPFAYRPFCPPSSCTYKPTSSFSSEAQIFNFFFKMFKILFSGSQAKLPDSDIVKLILLRSTPNGCKLDKRHRTRIMKAVDVLLSQIRRECDKTMHEVKPFLLVTCERELIKTSRSAVSCSFRSLEKSTTHLKTTPTDPFSSGHLTQFFKFHIFQSVKYNFLDLTRASERRCKDHVNSIQEIFTSFFTRDDNVKKYLRDEKDVVSEHMPDIKPICNALLKNANSRHHRSDQAYLFYTSKCTDLVYLDQPSGKVFICLICFQCDEARKSIQEVIDTNERQPNQINCDDEVCTLIMEPVVFTSGCIGTFQNVTAVHNHTVRKTVKILCTKCISPPSMREGKEFQTMENAISHFRVAHEKWNIYCPICLKDLHSPEQFKRHFRGNKNPCVKIQYDGRLMDELDIYQYICPSCNQSYENVEEVIHHLHNSSDCTNKTKRSNMIVQEEAEEEEEN